MKYYEYLEAHKYGVKIAYERLLEPILIDEEVDTSILKEIRYNISKHDDSKLTYKEYVPYDQYHQGLIKKNHPDYMRAWNYHQKNNPHHWQYWVLLRDSESPHTILLDIPLQYIIEMICDWISSSALHNTTANAWYSTYGDKMRLSKKTREIVEKYLAQIKDKEEGIHHSITNYNNVREEQST